MTSDTAQSASRISDLLTVDDPVDVIMNRWKHAFVVYYMLLAEVLEPFVLLLTLFEEVQTARGAAQPLYW